MMKFFNILNGSLFITGVVFLLTSCSSAPRSASTDSALASETLKNSVVDAGGSHYSVIKFDEGSADLTEANKEKLMALANVARQDGVIQDVEVLAWSDRDYRNPKQKTPKEAIQLADNRAQTIKQYLKDELLLSDVKEHNMVKKTGLFSKIFKTDDYEIKNIFDNKGEACKAVVFVEYQQ